MSNIPAPLLKSLVMLEGFDEKAFVDAHNTENKITSIRFNPFKMRADDLDFDLGEKVPWAHDAFYLASRPSFTFDPLFHAGCYYVQEAGSMFLEFILKNLIDFSSDLRVLDLCGAPGGKSTLINSLLNKRSVLVANEFIKNRSEILSHNLSKWGTANTVVTNNDPKKFSQLNGFFDAVVVDAPCSGSGLFRKQPGAIDEWSEDNVILCSNRQRTILGDILPCLKEDGILIYSTCSYSVAENEDVVSWLIAEHGMEFIQLPVDPEWGIVSTGKGYRFYPHLTKSEGFFCAALRKTQRGDTYYISKKKLLTPATKDEQALLATIVNIGDDSVIKKNNQFHLLNTGAGDFLNAFEKQFYFKKAGCVIGEIKGRDIVPNQDLAWSNRLGDQHQRLDVSKENAIKFLRKESFQNTGSMKGFVLITYKNHGLGWAKILPNRINNYFPNELRILK